MNKPSPRKEKNHTPLGREYARLSSLQTTDPHLDTFHARRSVPADELLVWSTRVGKARHPLGPPTTRSNPVIIDDLVLCSTFSPGGVVAFNRVTGARRWTLRLAYLGHTFTPGPPETGLAFGGTSQELLAVEAASGRVVWRFCPYGRTGESIYSAPSQTRDKLFVGDRRGYLHALELTTGKSVWKVLTSRAENCAVNSDPVVSGKVVAVGTNAGIAAGYEIASGRAAWRVQLDGPCTNVVPADGDRAVFWTRRVASLLGVRDGKVLGRWSRRHYEIEHACAAGDRLFLVTRRVWGRDRFWPIAELRGYRGPDETFVLSYPRWSGAAIRYEPSTAQVYEATNYGLGILNPRNGEREVVISFSSSDDYTGKIGLPTVHDGRLYAMTCDGRVFALVPP